MDFNAEIKKNNEQIIKNMKVLGIMLQPTFKEIAGNMVKAFNDSGIKLLCISEYGAIVKKPDGSIEAFCFDRKTE